MKIRVVMAGASALLLQLGCGNSSLSPRPVPLDKVNCSACGMMVSEERFAAEIVLQNGDVRYYDDLGCLAADGGVPQGRRREYVRGDDGKAWIAADAAFYARPKDLHTPMAYGFAAFSRGEEARAGDAAGHARRWEEVRSELLRSGSAR